MHSTYYDDQLRQIPGLTWLPWVGRHFQKHVTGRRLLVIGESHYSEEADPEKIAQSLREISALITYTREVIQEGPIDREYFPKPTLENIPRAILGDEPANRARFWGDIAFYNFVQRPLDYANEERPEWEDCVSAWPVFANVVRVLRPSYCIIMGIEASYSFPTAMKQLSLPFTPVKKGEKVGSAYPRITKVTIENRDLPLLFTKHPGKYFPWENWHECFAEKHPEIVEFIQQWQKPSGGEGATALPA